MLFHEFTEYGGFCCYKKNECKPDILELKVITNTSTRVNKFKSHKLKKKKKKIPFPTGAKIRSFIKLIHLEDGRQHTGSPFVCLFNM